MDLKKEKWYFLKRIWITIINSCIDNDGKDKIKVQILR